VPYHLATPQDCRDFSISIFFRQKKRKLSLPLFYKLNLFDFLFLLWLFQDSSKVSVEIFQKVFQADYIGGGNLTNRDFGNLFLPFCNLLSEFSYAHRDESRRITMKTVSREQTSVSGDVYYIYGVTSEALTTLRALQSGSYIFDDFGEVREFQCI
jgi:hypothetical protein